MLTSEQYSVNFSDLPVAECVGGIKNILIFQRTAGLPDLADICS